MGLVGRAMQYLWPAPIAVPAHLLVMTSHREWTLSQERQFMEDLVYKRLTLFLSISAALLTGAIALRGNPAIAMALLLGGTILCFILQQTVHRAQLKLDIILQILFNNDEHPTGRVNNIYNDDNRVRLVGVVVPTAVCLLLLVLTIVNAALAVQAFLARP